MPPHRSLSTVTQKRAGADACPYEWQVSFRESNSQKPRFQQLWGSSPRRHEQITKDVLKQQTFDV